MAEFIDFLYKWLKVYEIDIFNIHSKSSFI